MLHLRSIKAYCFNSSQAVSADPDPDPDPGPGPGPGPGTDSPVFGTTDQQMHIKHLCSCLFPIPGPPFPPESFDRVLLDAPCSGLGQRPHMACTWSLKEICSYQPLQRKLFHAVSFLSTTILTSFLAIFGTFRPVDGSIELLLLLYYFTFSENYI